MAPTRAQHPTRESPAAVPVVRQRSGSRKRTDDAICSAVCEVDLIDHAKVARARIALPALATVAALAGTFKALGDPTRLQIVSALAREELCVCDLATLVGVSQSAVSHSLRVLRDLRLVRYRKVGKIAYYRLDDSHIAALLEEGRRHVEEQFVAQTADRATA